MAEDKPNLTGLFRDNPETPEGKYLVKRRDGTVVEWPNFVLGARDPNASEALRFYALLNLIPPKERKYILDRLRNEVTGWLHAESGQNKEYAANVVRHADAWDEYRRTHGDGDPLKGRHRIDDPATITEMKKGHSA